MLCRVVLRASIFFFFSFRTVRFVFPVSKIAFAENVPGTRVDEVRRLRTDCALRFRKQQFGLSNERVSFFFFSLISNGTSAHGIGRFRLRARAREQQRFDLKRHCYFICHSPEGLASKNNRGKKKIIYIYENGFAREPREIRISIGNPTRPVSRGFLERELILRARIAGVAAVYGLYTRGPNGLEKTQRRETRV